MLGLIPVFVFKVVYLNKHWNEVFRIIFEGISKEGKNKPSRRKE